MAHWAAQTIWASVSALHAIYTTLYSVTVGYAFADATTATHCCQQFISNQQQSELACTLERTKQTQKGKPMRILENGLRAPVLQYPKRSLMLTSPQLKRLPVCIRFCKFTSSLELATYLSKVPTFKMFWNIQM